MHFIEQCKHGTVGTQCRCPGPKHVKTLVLCPDKCKFKSPPVGGRYPPPGVNVNGRGPGR